MELGVAAVGLGIGEQHALAYIQSGRCRLRWLYDLDREKSVRLASELRAGAVAGSFEEILRDPAVEIVSIASYDDAHFGQTLAALQANKHVFVEKPLCRSIEELRTLKAAWTAAGDRWIASNLVLRTAPAFSWLKGALQRGEFGRVFGFDGDYIYGRVHKITDGWRKNVADYSVIQGGAIHLVDLMLWLTNEKPVSVTAAGNRICTAGTEFRYHDYVTATYRFPSGMVGRIAANFGAVHPHQHVVRVFGTEATFISDDRGARRHTTREEAAAAAVVDLATTPASKGELASEFAGAIADRRDLQRQTQHEFDVVSVCLAADQALASNSPVSIEYV